MPTQMKDGLGNEFTLVTKDVSPDQNNVLRQNWHLYTRYPIDHAGGGSYQAAIRSGSMAAGLVANAPIVSFRFVSASFVALIRRIKFSAWTLGTGFAAGIGLFDAFVARGYTAEDTGGTLAALAGDIGKLSTLGMVTTTSQLRVASTAALTVGTRTLDGVALDTLMGNAPTTAQTLMITKQELFEEADHPLKLGTSEGLIIQATVPATGLWQFSVNVAWDEVAKVSF
jgi:hypothetical protein